MKLNELHMSPARLAREASTVDARVGIEFELFVPREAIGSEHDFTTNVPTQSIQSIVEFFQSTNENISNVAEKIAAALQDSKKSIVDRIIGNSWETNRESFVRYYLSTEVIPHDSLENLLTAKLTEKFGRTPTNNELRATVNNYVMQLSAKHLAANTPLVSQAYEAYREGAISRIPDLNEATLLANIGLRSMKDVSEQYSLTWPHDEVSTESDVERIAANFGEFTKYPYRTGEVPHEVERTGDSYAIEPDDSLAPDNKTDVGIEFVSWPMQLSHAFEHLNNVEKWAAKVGAYTNSSTGLHINVSTPNIENLDYVKLVLLLGDEYVLQQYGRLANQYCMSSIDLIKDAMDRAPNNVVRLFDMMKQQLNSTASKLVHSGKTFKYASVHPKDGYVEFRSPGGDWLGDNNNNLKKSILRFVVALDAASDPEKDKQTYLKKLYALIKPKDDPYLDSFLDYATTGNTRELRALSISKLKSQSNPQLP